MAIKYSELNKKINLKPLTPEEVLIISKIERFIDSEIIEQFKNTNTIHIDWQTATFRWDPYSKTQLQIKDIRRSLMHAELVKRYVKAGWAVQLNNDNRSELMTLTGKK